MNKKRKRRCRPALFAATRSHFVLVQVPAHAVGMFRFLLEAYEHLAYFSVLNRYTALLQVFCSPHRKHALLQALECMGESLQETHNVCIRLVPRPFVSRNTRHGMQQYDERQRMSQDENVVYERDTKG